MAQPGMGTSSQPGMGMGASNRNFGRQTSSDRGQLKRTDAGEGARGREAPSARGGAPNQIQVENVNERKLRLKQARFKLHRQQAVDRKKPGFQTSGTG